MSDPSASALAPALPAAGKRAGAAISLALVTLMFWFELLLEGDRAGFLGSLRATLLALTSGFPRMLQLAACAVAPFVALALAASSLRDARSRRAGLVALVSSAVLVALVLLAALGGGR